MSNREDYLDSLLNSVTNPGEEGFGRDILETEDDFLKKFDQQMLDIDDDDFLKEFELDLAEEADDTRELQEQLMEEESREPEEPGLIVNTLDQDDLKEVENDPLLETELDEDPYESGPDELESMLNEAMETAKQKVPVRKSKPDSENPKIEAEDLDVPKEAADGSNETKEDVGDDQDILDLLSGIENDEDLKEIGNMLKAEDDFEALPEEDLSGMARELTDEMDQLGFGPEEDQELEGETEIFADEDSEEESGKKKKKGKKEKKDKKAKKKGSGEEAGEGFLKKLSRIIFGEEDEDEIIPVPESGEVENISGENMEILKELEKENGSKDSKKAAKAEKKKEKQEKKEQKKKEKQEKKEQKPKKEKLPKEPKVREKTKPLPKGPVILISIMTLSILVLILLSSSLLGYTTGLDAAKEAYEKGNYVEAFSMLQGMEIKEEDQTLYDRARLSAYLQSEWKSYESFIDKKLYADALNALVCGAGKYDSCIEEAKEAGVEGEYKAFLKQIKGALKDQFGVSLKEAKALYSQEERSEYTVQLYALLDRAGLQAQQEQE